MSEDYSKMTDNELIELYHKCMHDSEQYNVSQLVKKILLSNQGHDIVIYHWDCCENGESL